MQINADLEPNVKMAGSMSLISLKVNAFPRLKCYLKKKKTTFIWSVLYEYSHVHGSFASHHWD